VAPIELIPAIEVERKGSGRKQSIKGFHHVIHSEQQQALNESSKEAKKSIVS
jgi:hypothetical protein